jgi:predicted glycoside hydrolase/deacetylase ChbG (UPF0249 family)
MVHAAPGAYLIVNADDYGYFRCVSMGILKAATHGIVTATGVLSNGSDFAEHAARLRDHEGLDVGVHLNLTDGAPLTREMGERLSRWSGRFPGKFRMAAALLSGAVKTEDVAREWRAQIERCMKHGVRVRFLNSHEHLHMLPSLFEVITALAGDYGIAHIRVPTSRLFERAPNGSLFRGVAIKALEAINRRHAERPRAQFLGLEPSGKLDLPYLERCTARLRAGEIYELMCHPGEFDAREVTDARLARYHDWQGELDTLTSAAARELLHRHGVQLIGYRDLDVEGDRLLVRREPALA